MKPISAIVESSIPMFIRMEYPNFVNFIKGYYQWAEQEGQAYEFIANAPDYMNLDTTSLQLLEQFASIYLEPLPDIIYEQNNLATLIKNIVQHFQAKGNENSFKFLFRLIEGREVEFYYPSVDMHRISDGKWSNYQSIKIEDPPEDVMEWESSEIVGDESNARAIIDFIRLYESDSGKNIAELFLVEVDHLRPIDNFEIGEVFAGTTYGGKYFTGTIIPVFARTEIVEDAKFQYKGIRLLPISTNGEDASVVIDHIERGEVEDLTIINGGIGYEVNDQIVFDVKGYGTGAYGRVSEVDGSGTITGVELTFGGHDYDYIPSPRIISSSGQNAILMSESEQIGRVSAINIRNFGVHYEETTDIDVPLMIRIHSQHMDFEIGESITSPSGSGIILSHDKISQIMGIQVDSGAFNDGEEITGARMGATATIYDTAQAEINFVEGAVCNYKGQFINNDGQISSTKYVQDSYFYQVFSYMIETFKLRDEWFDYIKSVHPSGTISFGFREIPNKQKINEGFGGTYGPTLDMTELYRFQWLDGNTQIKQYGDIVIDDVINRSTNVRDRTNHCFGSTITIS